LWWSATGGDQTDPTTATPARAAGLIGPSSPPSAGNGRTPGGKDALVADERSKLRGIIVDPSSGQYEKPSLRRVGVKFDHERPGVAPHDE
jgi:hypothetical protein